MGQSLYDRIKNILIDISKKRQFFYFSVCHGTLLFKYAEKTCMNIMKWEQKNVDPPIPPGTNIYSKYKKYFEYKGSVKILHFTIFSGAIKLNYSTRLSSLVVRFCDKDIDLMEIKILGLENDCIYNANERMVLRAHLRNILAEDLIDDTLYSKVMFLIAYIVFFYSINI